MLENILKKKFPTGSLGPGAGIYQGECISFLHAVFQFPTMGDTVGEKINFLKSQGQCAITSNIADTFQGFRIGDFVITSEGAYKNWLGQWKGTGHGAIITGFDKDQMILAESNFLGNHKVYYGRRLPMNSLKILGIGRYPFKIDLGVKSIPFNYDIFYNNFPYEWKTLRLKELVETFTSRRLNLNVFGLNTRFKNWWYDVVMQDYKVISQGYILDNVMPLSFTSHNAPANAVALIINRKEWQGSVLSNPSINEVGYYHFGTNPGQIQICAEQSDVSFWYPDLKLAEHALVHELAHMLKYIAGQPDNVHVFDSAEKKALSQVFTDIDWNRIALNL